MRALALLAALALVPACTTRAPGERDGGTEPGGDDTGFVGHDANLPDFGPPVDGGGCYDPIDLVFVLDVSTSMTEEFAHLRDGIASIYAAADALTTDHTFAIVVFVDDVLVVDGCGQFETPDALQAQFDHWRTFCSSNGEPGGARGQNGDCPENSIDAIYDAATMCTWRDGATHVIIHVTDDTFLESPAHFSNGLPAMHTYAETSAALLAAQIHVGAFAQRTPAACGAGTSANTAQGFLEDYMGMPSLPDATGGRAWDIAQVRDGSLDMATAINELIVASHCAPF